MDTNTKIKGIKLEMTQVFSDTGMVIPVTRVVTTENLVSDLENKEVEVVGTSKGKGFAGVMKKWNFKGSMATRGQSTKPRAAGSIGGQTPGRVFKGKKMAGRLGNKQVTVKGIKIVKVDATKHELLVSGPLPGARNSEVSIKVL
jgi:large subunit ribosomal protein L3